MRHILNGTTSRIAFAKEGSIFGGANGWFPFGSRSQPQVHPQNNGGRPDTSGASDDDTGGDEVDRTNVTADEMNEEDLQNFLDNNKSLWEDDPNENRPDPDAEARAAAAAKESSESLKNYILGLDFKLDIDMPKFKEALEKDDPKYFQQFMNGAMQRVFARMLTDVQKLVSNAESRMGERMSSVTQSNLSARESELSLMMHVPLAKNPMVKPMALAMKARFMKQKDEQGKPKYSDEEANEQVRKSFAVIRKTKGEDLGLEEQDDDLTRPPNGRRPKNERDWVSELTRSPSR